MELTNKVIEILQNKGVTNAKYWVRDKCIKGFHDGLTWKFAVKELTDDNYIIRWENYNEPMGYAMIDVNYYIWEINKEFRILDTHEFIWELVMDDLNYPLQLTADSSRIVLTIDQIMKITEPLDTWEPPIFITN